MTQAAPTTLSKIAKEFKVNRQGKEAVLYVGLLDYAHRELAPLSIRTVLIQAPRKDNDYMAIMWAEVTCSAGTFTGIGDATPENVGRMVALHTVRMAETRAKARALRDAMNLGGVALEELGPEEEDEPVPPRNARPERLAPQEPTPIRPATTNAAITSNGLATAEQIDRIHKLTAALGRGVTTDLSKLTTSDAAGIITDLVKVFNAQPKKAETPPTPRPLAPPMTDAQRRQIAELQRAVGTTDRVEEMTEERAQIHINELLKVQANKAAAAAAKVAAKPAKQQERPDSDPATNEDISALGKLAGQLDALGGAAPPIPSAMKLGQARAMAATIKERLAELKGAEPPVGPARGSVVGARP